MIQRVESRKMQKRISSFYTHRTTRCAGRLLSSLPPFFPSVKTITKCPTWTSHLLCHKNETSSDALIVTCLLTDFKDNHKVYVGHWK